ncbi:MAG: hypothetical protein AAGA16_23395, partial [Cyanobacteria bacterium P01_E01_bin.35]
MPSLNNHHLPNPHRRQFVIGYSEFIPNEDWRSHKLSSNFWISYDLNLNLNRATDNNGIEWVLLGLATETTENIAPEDLISLRSTQEVIDGYSAWAGRWLLIGQGEIHLDANGLLGCFYGEKSSGDIWLSSSPTLLAEIMTTNAQDDRNLVYGGGISWYTPPYSGYPQIKRLLASQVLNFTTGQISPRPLMPEIDLNRDYETSLDLVKNALVTALQNLGKLKQPIWLGLTAGYDSRLMLAIANIAQCKLTTFTRIAGRMSLADFVIPPQLAKECKIPHIFLNNKLPQEQNLRRNLVRQHAGNNISSGDAEPFIMGVRDSLKGISFGGHGFAIASGFHTLGQLPANFADPQTGAVQIAQLFNEPPESSAVAGMTAWLSWVQQHPQANLDWRDRFFLEQRQAGWLSSKEQVYDLSDLIRFPILNAARTYSLLLSIPEAKRLDSLVQVAILKQLNPNLLKYPFNPDNDYFNLWSKLRFK